MMSSWLRDSSCLHSYATQDIRLQSCALLGFRHSLVVALDQRHRAQSIAASAHRSRVLTRRKERALYMSPLTTNVLSELTEFTRELSSSTYRCPN